MLVALDAGAEDITDDGDHWQVTTPPGDLAAVRTALEEAGIAVRLGRGHHAAHHDGAARQRESDAKQGAAPRSTCSRTTTTCRTSTPTSTSPTTSSSWSRPDVSDGGEASPERVRPARARRPAPDFCLAGHRRTVDYRLRTIRGRTRRAGLLPGRQLAGLHPAAALLLRGPRRASTTSGPQVLWLSPQDVASHEAFAAARRCVSRCWPIPTRRSGGPTGSSARSASTGGRCSWSTATGVIRYARRSLSNLTYRPDRAIWSTPSGPPRAERPGRDPPSTAGRALLASNECSPSASIRVVALRLRRGRAASGGRLRCSASGSSDDPARATRCASAWPPCWADLTRLPGRAPARRGGRRAGPVPGQRPHGHVGRPGERAGPGRRRRGRLPGGAVQPQRGQAGRHRLRRGDQGAGAAHGAGPARPGRAAPAGGPGRRPRPGHLPPGRRRAAGGGRRSRSARSRPVGPVAADDRLAARRRPRPGGAGPARPAEVLLEVGGVGYRVLVAGAGTLGRDRRAGRARRSCTSTPTSARTPSSSTGSRPATSGPASRR